MNYKIPLNKVTVWVCTAVFCGGLFAGAGGAWLLHKGQVSRMTAQVHELAIYSQSLSIQLGQASLASAGIDLETPRLPVASTPLPPPAPSTPQSASTEVVSQRLAPREPPRRAVAATPPARPSAPPAQSTALAVPVAVAQRLPQLPITLPAQPSSPLASQPSPAAASPPPPVPVLVNGAPGAVAVTMEQAGIVGVDATGIKFKSGRQVGVGSDFPTGERLVSVDPTTGRIVTDRRVIQLKPPTQAMQVLTP